MKTNKKTTMKGITFNDRYGLETAVLNGTKTRTWRADKKPRFEVGDVVAIKQCKMFVKNELMPHKIKITAIKKCRLQDLTDDECIREGLIKVKKGYAILFSGLRTSHSIVHENPKTLFAYLIQLLNGSGYWENNPEGYAYEFELIK